MWIYYKNHYVDEPVLKLKFLRYREGLSLLAMQPYLDKPGHINVDDRHSINKNDSNNNTTSGKKKIVTTTTTTIKIIIIIIKIIIIQFQQ